MLWAKADSQGQAEEFCYKVSEKIAGAKQFLFQGMRENTMGVDAGLCRAPLRVAVCVRRVVSLYSPVG